MWSIRRPRIYGGSVENRYKLSPTLSILAEFDAKMRIGNVYEARRQFDDLLKEKVSDAVLRNAQRTDDGLFIDIKSSRFVGERKLVMPHVFEHVRGYMAHNDMQSLSRTIQVFQITSEELKDHGIKLDEIASLLVGYVGKEGADINVYLLATAIASMLDIRDVLAGSIDQSKIKAGIEMLRSGNKTFDAEKLEYYFGLSDRKPIEPVKTIKRTESGDNRGALKPAA